LPLHGGTVFIDYAILVAIAGNGCLLGWLIYQFHRSTKRMIDLENQLGGLFHALFEKLEKFEQMAPDMEPPNPLFGLIQSMITENTIKGRDDSGRFVQAEIIPPDQKE
tara:strand:+ start:88 stop:411 length:324 start_codon:yes stop_codon:yes gene_type:complete